MAGRLAEERGRPAVVATEIDGVIRASCRSAAGIDLPATLAECADLFIRHGGHPGAAGFEIAGRALGRVPRAVPGDLVTNAAPPSSDPRPELKVDLVVPGPEVDYAFLAELRRLDPTGPGNPDPLVVVEGLTVTRVRAASGGHSQLTLRKRLDVVDGIAFGRADLASEVHEGDRLDVVARIVTRVFGGYESIQLEIRDAAPAGHAAELAAGSVEPRAARRRSGPMTRRAARGRAGARPAPTRTGSVPAGSLSPRSLALAGLLVIALVTLALFTGSVPLPGGGGRPQGSGGVLAPNRTAAPSNVVIVDPRTNIPGHAGVRQAGQPVDPDRQQGGPDHDERGGLDAELVRRRPVDLLHRERPRPGLLPGRRRRPQPLRAGLSGPDPDPRRRLRRGEAPQRSLPAGPVHVVLLDPPAAGLTGRQDGGPGLRRPRSDQERRRAPDVRREDQEDQAHSGSPRMRRSVTRTRPGAPMASSCST